MRAVYVLLTYLLAPIVIALEGWKALWNPEYRGRLHQRKERIVRPVEGEGAVVAQRFESPRLVARFRE